MGLRSGLARIHAMKFYELARTPQSMVRVGQDLVDELVWIHDFQGARDVLEKTVFPTIQSMGLLSEVLPARALYAVVLAYCGDHDAADAELQRILPYRDAMHAGHRAALADQQALISGLRKNGGPPQREFVPPPALQALFDQRRGKQPKPSERRTKIGRNERCPCGSGVKYKHCHGR
ncbi:SEC-C domain-containing protein [Stakelama sp. CBK3Z-3]|uniref:SEC-C domain-containing protein n=2 Tax=Stakelama flava TaxID=2860338 RepID=A0ABS6XPH0_9SPHN|nr:SEC-C domain-containing protein [Stakelama flava]